MIYLFILYHHFSWYLSHTCCPQFWSI